MTVVGIDLGTTNTVVASIIDGRAVVLADDKGRRLLPSVVSFHPNGNVLVGREAVERRFVDAKNTIYSVKRLIGRAWNSPEVQKAIARSPFELREGPSHGPLVFARGETYSLPEISSMVLRRAKVIAERSVGPVSQAVITVPASFNDLQRAATKVAAMEAGLETLRILNEPTAAAVAYGYGRDTDERIAVFDFGGGTFDLTLLSLTRNVFEVIATSGDSFLGGDDIDQAIADQIVSSVLQQYRFDPRTTPESLEQLRAAGESIKISLSTETSARAQLPDFLVLPGGRTQDVSFSLSIADFERLAEPIAERAIAVCAEALKLAQMKVSDLHRLILVGGSSRVPIIRHKAKMFFGLEPQVGIQPEEVVALGACIQASTLTSSRASVPPPPGTSRHRSSTIPGAGSARKANPPPRAPTMFTLARDAEPSALPGPAPALASPATTSTEPAEDEAPHTKPYRGKLPGAVEPQKEGGYELATPRAFESPPAIQSNRFENSYPEDLAGAAVFPAPPAAKALKTPLSFEPAFPSAPPPAMAAPVPLTFERPPLLLDVTPLTLSVETVGGFVDPVIARNTVVPCANARMFTTSIDDQEIVHIRVCQGESRVVADNTQLGILELSGIRKTRRGEVQIQVTFELDADGILQVSARDMETKSQTKARMKLIGLGE